MTARAHLRLNQFLAAAGLGSRRACEALIRDGLISVNNKRITHLATRVGPQDRVYYNNREVIIRDSKQYYLLHKPAGFICSKKREGSLPTIYELLPPQLHRLFYLGRLDAESEGLLLLTDDGYLGQRLTHPRFKVDKKYRVTLNRKFDIKDKEKLLKGIFLEGKRARFKAITLVKGVTIEVILDQGLKRQIRQQLYRAGYEVKRLVRIGFGQLALAPLPVGHFRELKAYEIKGLRAA